MSSQETDMSVYFITKIKVYEEYIIYFATIPGYLSCSKMKPNFLKANIPYSTTSSPEHPEEKYKFLHWHPPGSLKNAK